jgi:nucleotide-binding universal stress UspA family protein
LHRRPRTAKVGLYGFRRQQVQRFVVGLDGSDGSARALSWALDLADAVGNVEVLVVHVCEDAVTAYEKGFCTRSQADEWLAESRADAERMLHGLLGQAGRRVPASVRLESVPGRPAEVLIEQSADADLLVVGPRGLGRLRGLLGSVSQACVAHAQCPVVVTRLPEAG